MRLTWIALAMVGPVLAGPGVAGGVPKAGQSEIGLRMSETESPPHPAAYGGSPLPPGERANVLVGPSPLAGEGGAQAPGEGGLLPYKVVAGSVPKPLGGLEGDPERGKAVVRDRRVGNCLICHTFPIEGEAFQGEIGPSLAGVASRITEAQIRLRLIDQSRINPETIMPPYYRVQGLTNVAPEYRGKPALDAQELEDVVAYLAGLTE